MDQEKQKKAEVSIEDLKKSPETQDKEAGEVVGGAFDPGAVKPTAASGDFIHDVFKTKSK